MNLVTLEEIQSAAALLKGIVHTTPLKSSRVLQSLVGGPVWLKCENLQRAGSFKIRGAYVRIARLSGSEREKGVVAASAGNHAQGVALAAGLLDVRATAFMPVGASLPKVEATTNYGAVVEFVGETVADALRTAQDYGQKTGAVLIHPFDHLDVITGQGTVGLEILEQCPEVHTVVAAVGGGGLISGIAAAIKRIKPSVRVVGVQALGAAAFPPSLKAGHPITVEQVSTMADGIAVGSPGSLTLAHVRELVDEITTVSEEAISKALLLCLERAKLVVEPAGAAAVAAILDKPERFEPPVVAVLSGGNVDPVLLLRVIQHGMISAGRYLQFRVRVLDRPGQLASVLRLVGEHGANVLSVEHSRTGRNLHLGEVEVMLSVETRGPAHAEELVSALQDAGHLPIFD